jgi:hypothetical protein
MPARSLFYFLLARIPTSFNVKLLLFVFFQHVKERFLR